MTKKRENSVSHMHVPSELNHPNTNHLPRKQIGSVPVTFKETIFRNLQVKKEQSKCFYFIPVSLRNGLYHLRNQHLKPSNHSVASVVP